MSEFRPENSIEQEHRTSTPYEMCDYITGSWLLENGYVAYEQLGRGRVSSVSIMSSGRDEGVDLRLEIDRLHIDNQVGSAFTLKRRVGTSDESLAKEIYAITPEKEILRRVKPGRYPTGSAKLIEHIQEIIEKPATVSVTLEYDINMPLGLET